MAENPNKDFWSPAEKVQLREYFRVLGNCPPFRPAEQIEAERNGTLPPYQPIFSDLKLLQENPAYDRNLKTREKNLAKTLDDLDADLIPLLDIQTRQPIEGFPKKLRQIDELGYDEGIRILKALGEPNREGDEWAVIYRVRRWAATAPTKTETWQEDKRGTEETENPEKKNTGSEEKEGEMKEGAEKRDTDKKNTENKNTESEKKEDTERVNKEQAVEDRNESANKKRKVDEDD